VGNNKEYLTKSSQFKGKIMCNNLELGGYKDWRLPKIDELSNFHKKVYENNVTIKRNFDKCALEISDKFENNQEYGVVTQAIGSLSDYHVGDEVSIGALLFTNTALVGLTYFLEKYWQNNLLASMNIDYEKIENVKPENHEALLADLKERTGLNIQDFQFSRMNFLRDTVRIKIYYKE